MEALGKDQARINAMRARNEARRERFLNARQRAIGVDVDALDAQCAERAGAKAADAAEDAEHASRQAYVAQLVEQREMQEKALKTAEMHARRRAEIGRAVPTRSGNVKEGSGGGSELARVAH